MTKTWRFEPFDSWFFRESRPFGSMGDSELGSVFPPPTRTLAGALRTLMGESIGVDWQAFGQHDGSRHRLEGVDLVSEIGMGQDLGRIRLGGPWLARGTASGATERYLPAPRFLMADGKSGSITKVSRLCIGEPQDCDLGKVRLPAASAFGLRSLEGAWLTLDAYTRVLAGETPKTGDVVQREALFCEEPRLGIARDNRLRTGLVGLLYQLRHIRPAPCLFLELTVSGADPRLLSLDEGAGEMAQHSGAQLLRRTVRLGGEGRLASISIREGAAPLPAAPEPNSDTQGLILCLLTAADLGDRGELPGFRAEDSQGVRAWQGEINGVPLTLHCAVIGRAEREGGWNLAKRRPSAVRSFVPAGSAWYSSVRGGMPPREAIRRLHGAQIGDGQAFGRGQLAVGLWQDADNTTSEDKHS